MGLPIFHLLRVLTDSQIQVLGTAEWEKAVMQKHLQDWLLDFFFSSNIDFPFSNYIWWTITLFKGDATLLDGALCEEKKKELVSLILGFFFLELMIVPYLYSVFLFFLSIAACSLTSLVKVSWSVWMHTQLTSPSLGPVCSADQRYRAEPKKASAGENKELVFLIHSFSTLLSTLISDLKGLKLNLFYLIQNEF